MKTWFKTKAEAKACAEADGGYIYRTHRGYIVEYKITPVEIAKVQAGDKVEDDKSNVALGDGAPIW